MDLHPTTTCFDDALDGLGEILREHSPQGLVPWPLYLVHGLCHNPDGEPFSHAWVEMAGNVVSWFLIEGQRAMVEFEGLDDYYAKFNVTETYKYTVREAVTENHRTGYYGPWVPRLQALTIQGKATARPDEASAAEAGRPPETSVRPDSF